MASEDEVPLFRASLGQLTCDEEDCDPWLNQCNAEEAGNNEWVRIESLVDSGAARSVCPTAMCADIAPLTTHQGPRYFRTATGDRIPNQGIRRIRGVTETGRNLAMQYNVAAVDSPLDSVSQICDRGNIVVFTSKGGYICGERGRIAFQRKNDTYHRTTWVRRPRRSQEARRHPDAMEIGALEDFPGQAMP